jgi:hypothetical protein
MHATRAVQGLCLEAAFCPSLEFPNLSTWYSSGGKSDGLGLGSHVSCGKPTKDETTARLLQTGKSDRALSFSVPARAGDKTLKRNR